VNQKILDTSANPNKIRLARQKLQRLTDEFWATAEIKAGLQEIHRELEEC
jgi:hypothetical protein